MSAQDAITAQEVFDTVYLHLVKQGERSMDEAGEECRYRGSHGMSCAVGCLITDAEYVPEREGLSVEHLIAHGCLPERLIPHEELLIRLQDTHDSGYNIGDDFLGYFVPKMKNVAKSFHLTVPINEATA